MNDFKLKHKQRLRERFIKEGLDGFHDYEVLELILSYSLTRIDTKPIAKKLIEHFGNISSVMNASTEELCQIDGISIRTAILLKIIKDSSTYMMQDKIINTNYIKSAGDVIDYLHLKYKADKTETFIAIYLNSRNMILNMESLFKGTVNEARVYIRILVEQTLKYGASAVIIAHNHPSGSLEISSEDLMLTRKIKEVLKYIDVRMLDHIIISSGKHISMNEMKMI